MHQLVALFVDRRGPYWNRPEIDAWDEKRNALGCIPRGTPVLAHPPCERWGRYWGGGPSAKVKRKMGDDGGCFRFAFEMVCIFGGVLEHPEASHAWRAFGIVKPPKSGGWIAHPFQPAYQRRLGHGMYAWTCCVEQGHYGHPARKATWLLYVGKTAPPDLIWGKSAGVRLDEGFHSKAERDAARARGQKPIKRLSTVQNIVTPLPFAELLIKLALHSRVDNVNAKG